MPASIERHPLAWLGGGACLVSLAPILVKAVTLYDMGPNAIAVWRCVIGAALFFAFAAVSRTRIRVEPGTMLFLVLIGLAFSVDLNVWHRSIVLVGAGMATILGNTQVFFTALLSALFFREKLSLRFAGAATSALFGVTLLAGVGSDIEWTGDYLRGLGFGLATGGVYAVFLTLMRAAARRSNTGSTLIRPAWFSLYSALFLIGGASVSGEPLQPPTWQAWVLLFLLALLAQVLGWWAISSALPRVKGSVGGLMLLLQPVLATVWSVILFDEKLVPLQIAGAAITLGAIYVGSTGGRARP